MSKVALFASGTGTNAQKIIEYFQSHPSIKCVLLISNKKEAPALAMAQSYGLETKIIKRDAFYNSQELLKELQSKDIDFLVLAGFLWLVPSYLTDAYPNKIVNIHPALLPKYGGKGMYGMNVHRAVKAKQEKESGITIHYVNEHYDEGAIIFQAACKLEDDDSPEQIAKKVQKLEHQYFAQVIESVIKEQANKEEHP